MSILNPVIWLRQQICIEQILVEVHRGRSGKGKDPCAHSPYTNGHVSYQDQVMKVHKLLTAFDEAQLDVFWRARGGGPGGCILFGAVRRTLPSLERSSLADHPQGDRDAPRARDSRQ